MAKINKQNLWWQWILANVLGELVGLGATFAIGVGLFSGLTDSPELAAALLSAGLMTATGNLLGWDHIAIESLFSPATSGANRSTPMRGVHLGNWPGLHRNTNF
jgi:hypothetical protein